MLPRPLLQVWPQLSAAVSFEALAELPTPVEPLSSERAPATTRAFIKRDDLSSPVYGGNKVRTLEVLFGAARRRGVTRIYATGAFGSNHAVATVLHAPRVGLEPGAILFPQPESPAAVENLRVVASQPGNLVALPHWSALPFGLLRTIHRERQAGRCVEVMLPGGAVPEGALGYVSAALELGAQIERGELPLPREVIIGVGSTCTSAGLLVGFTLASKQGIGFRKRGEPAPPHLRCVRVTPWPVTSRFRILGLAVRTSQLLARLANDPGLALTRRELASRFTVDGRFLGRGYGVPTAAGLDAMAEFVATGGPVLDTTYSAKAAAALLDALRTGAPGPLLYWATKSAAPLPAALVRSDAPGRILRWLERAEKRAGVVGPGESAR